MNHEALIAAVAKRKSRLEQREDHSVVNEIEARLNRNKKLQAAKYFGDVNRGSQDAKKEDQVSSSAESATAPPGIKEDDQNRKIAAVPKDVAARSEPDKQATQVKHSPAVPVKSNQNEENSSKTISSDSAKNVASVDFRARLKPVDVKSTVSNITVHAKSTAAASVIVSTQSTTGANITTIVTTKASSNKVAAPPAPPPPTTTVSSVSVMTSKTKTEAPSSADKTGQNSQEMKSPLSPTSATVSKSPSASTMPLAADYITLAEKARQEYLKKRASGNLQANIEKKGPVEITPNKKNLLRGKTTPPASPTNTVPTSSTKSGGPTLTEVKPAHETKGENTQISVQDRIKTLQANGKTVLAGVTEDHSHTEISLSNGTLKKAKSNISDLPAQNTVKSSTGLGPKLTPGYGDKNGNSPKNRGIVLNIIPPPSTFSGATGSPDSAFSQDDAASFASSLSSVSTLSSEHGSRLKTDIKDLIAHSPPPPPDFNDFSLGDQDAFIPPPPEFLEIDANANESKRMDENSKPFANKSACDWTCLDVLDWLDSLGLPQYRISFAKASVDGSKLVNMSRNDFLNLGVTQVGHRMSLERSVKKLNMGVSTNL